tara:strand:- start:210 stop:833 length:624 start_codon:yes stop_codon:yes gene_type:complete
MTLNKHKMFRVILISLLTLSLLACDSGRLTPLNQNDVIVAFGDSLTEGVGTNEENNYPSVLAKLAGFNVINAGVSGETTSEGLIRLPSVIEEYQPSVLILLEGGNDILRNHSAKTIESNLDNMINIALDNGIQVVLIGVPEKSLFSSSAPFYGRLAEKYDLVFDSSLIASLLRSPSKKSDSVHFNTAGYASLAEGIYELLSDNGAFH